MLIGHLWLKHCGSQLIAFFFVDFVVYSSSSCQRSIDYWSGIYYLPQGRKFSRCGPTYYQGNCRQFYV